MDTGSNAISSEPCVAKNRIALSTTEIAAPVPSTRSGSPAPAFAPAAALPVSILVPNVTPPMATTMPLIGIVTPMVVRSSSLGAMPVKNMTRPKTPMVTIVRGLTRALPAPNAAAQT